MNVKVIVRGKVQGSLLVARNPINFLGGIDKKTGLVHDKKHDLFGKSIGNKILAFPFGVGSSVGAYTLYSLKYNNCAPLAIICLKADLTTASGCAISNIPLVVIEKNDYDLLQEDNEITLDAIEGKIL
ncbi:MAG: aconitase X swivel domain-containing protein [Nitrosotalea sp.]